MTLQIRSARGRVAEDLVCLSHLRWDFVYQRPQHLMSRFASRYRVFFVEEPEAGSGEPRLKIKICPASGVNVVTPQLPPSLSLSESERLQEWLLGRLMAHMNVEPAVAWYYSPMALGFTASLHAEATVYDCMDELSLFRGAPPQLLERETGLFARADLVFTGGMSLYEAKCFQHPEVYAFPSSVDVAHFRAARSITDEPADQPGTRRLRVGYCGVIDERLDMALLDNAARLQPDWDFVMLGPLAKITPNELPRRDNIHYLGPKKYDELPGYLAGWDAAMMPFARNEATRFISPTKTPEYLAAGLPVVSTPVRDVVRTYGAGGYVHIADDAEMFVQAVKKAVCDGESRAWLGRVDELLETMSWDTTWNGMDALVAQVRTRKQQLTRTAQPRAAS